MLNIVKYQLQNYLRYPFPITTLFIRASDKQTIFLNLVSHRVNVDENKKRLKIILLFSRNSLDDRNFLHLSIALE